MSMDKIDGSSVLRQGILDNTRQSERIDDQKKKKDQATGPAPSALPGLTGDTAVISDMAHRLMEMRQAMEVGYAALEALPEIRQDKVAQARDRLSQGSVGSDAVRGKIADGVAKVFKGMDSL
ncbi:MAG: flagellar biosynthesis anti-sigma factor FlgM [Candidatus Krumholzibacteria bacterium]|nr:flagellar biosynthesis anti-sigma factor FlgM [Candidatus Krumholzibacteria bacterium]